MLNLKLKNILKDVDVEEIINFKNYDIRSITHISADVEKSSMFICIEGQNFDGNDYAEVAVSCGAKCVVSNKKLDIKNATIVIVKDVRIAMSMIAKNYYHRVCDKLKIIGVIGTSGKTTTSTLIASFLRKKDNNIGVIGTNGIFIGDLKLDNKFTTPDPLELHYIFFQMHLMGVKTVVMEVSAQAIYLHKLFGIMFDICVFTNISKEHLDFFETMENYVRCKMSFFHPKNMIECVINVDDFYGMELAYKSLIPCVTYAIKEPANSFAIDIKLSLDGSSFVANILDEIIEVNSIMVGEFNVYNLLASMTVAKMLNMTADEISDAVNNLKPIDGRFNVFEFDNKKIIVDFAHTPDSIEKTLSVVKHFSTGKIITLFGCVGYSDKEKRKEMSMMVDKYSDYIIISTDNRGTTPFQEICDDMIAGIVKCDHIAIEERSDAIKYGIEMLSNGDILCVLGKGAENFQKINEERIEYSDLEVVKRLLKDNI